MELGVWRVGIASEQGESRDRSSNLKGLKVYGA